MAMAIPMARRQTYTQTSWVFVFARGVTSSLKKEVVVLAECCSCTSLLGVKAAAVLVSVGKSDSCQLLTTFSTTRLNRRTDTAVSFRVHSLQCEC